MGHQNQKHQHQPKPQHTKEALDKQEVHNAQKDIEAKADAQAETPAASEGPATPGDATPEAPMPAHDEVKQPVRPTVAETLNKEIDSNPEPKDFSLGTYPRERAMNLIDKFKQAFPGVGFWGQNKFGRTDEEIFVPLKDLAGKPEDTLPRIRAFLTEDQRAYASLNKKRS